MSDTNPTLTNQELSKGEYCPAPPGALRSPCPVLNAWANHGYLPRDGRNATAAQFHEGFKVMGVGPDVATLLISASFKEHHDRPDKSSPGPSTDDHDAVLTGGHKTGGPTSGMRRANQVNDEGVPVLDMDQISQHGIVEHDVSLSRNDFAQGDNHSPQPHLIDAFLNCAKDGETIFTSDLAGYRVSRINQQKVLNPDLEYGLLQESMGCGEAAFLQTVFGTGVWYAIPVRYMKALFADERLPFEEGWTKRLVPVLLPELSLFSAKIKLSK